MARPSRLTDDQRARLAAVLTLRQSLPTDDELARECGMTVWGVRWYMSKMMKKVELLQPVAVTTAESSGNLSSP